MTGSLTGRREVDIFNGECKEVTFEQRLEGREGTSMQIPEGGREGSSGENSNCQGMPSSLRTEVPGVFGLRC